MPVCVLSLAPTRPNFAHRLRPASASQLSLQHLHSTRLHCAILPLHNTLQGDASKAAPLMRLDEGYLTFGRFVSNGVQRREPRTAMQERCSTCNNGWGHRARPVDFAPLAPDVCNGRPLSVQHPTHDLGPSTSTPCKHARKQIVWTSHRRCKRSFALPTRRSIGGLHVPAADSTHDRSTNT